MAQDLENRLTTVGDYKHGSIRRIRLTNFLTYTNVDITPGPRLNMVVGPNGTGKSTILCAICLGLGGEPKFLGRASDIETFVANGEEEGEIEIEIANTKGEQNPVIRRRIRREGKPKSDFHWNDKPVSGKLVREECLKEYHISVDNLCTFLPQERVGSFSGFDSKQLLFETEKSLCASQHLFHTHMELIQNQQDLQGGYNHVDTLQERLQQLQHENQRLEREKQRMEERQLALDQADLLRKKLLWLKVDALITGTKAMKETKSLRKQEHREANEQVAPLEEKYIQIKAETQRCLDETNELDKQIRSHRREMEKQAKKYEAHDDEIETIVQELHAMDAQRANKARKVADLKAKMEQYQQTMKDYPPMEQLREEELQCRNDQKAVIPQYETARRDHLRLQQASREIEDERRRVEAKWDKLQDEKARRRDRIFRQQPNLRAIYEWLQKHRAEFRKEVLGPIVCEITPKSSSAAAYLEQHVPNSTLKAFVVQCKEDYDFLYKSVRQGLKLPININMVKEIPHPKPPMYSDEKMHILKSEHGVVGFMEESFTAPDLVVQALKSAASLEKVLVGTEKTQHSLDNRDLLNYLAESENGDGKLRSCCVFASQGEKAFKYTSTISRYSGKPSLRVDDIRPAKWLAPGVSDEAKQRVEDELKEIKEREAQTVPAVQEARRKLAETEEQAQQAKAKSKAAKENVNSLQRMYSKLKNSEAKLREAEADLATNDEEEKQHKMQQVGKRIHHSILALEAHSTSYREMMMATTKYSGARLNREAVTAEGRRRKQQFDEAMILLSRTEEAFRQASDAFKRAKAEVHEAKRVADEEAPMEDEQGNELALKAQLEDLPVDTLEEAELALEEAETKANSIIADPNVVRDYERRKTEMEEVQAQLDDLTRSKERRISELQEKVHPWEKSLDHAVQKIDALFSKYMAELGCTGEVHLTKGNQSNDLPHGILKDWGIEIRVSFRENVKPQILSARFQSGGERSVSTIMYLMALQDQMVAPFRCVDEINQGLDERNERLVFRRIVENSTRPPETEGPTHHSGQYFLITPKLLPNLYDMEVEAMTVLFIFNGPYNFRDPRDWDVGRLIGLRKRPITETEAAGDDENIPNSKSAERSPKKARTPLLTSGATN